MFVEGLYITSDVGARAYNFAGKQLVITGGVAAGKSTMCQIIANSVSNDVKVEMIPEYICSVEGQRLLPMYLSGEISDTTFQNYICDYYSNVYNKINFKSSFVISERLPSDSVCCFANIANRKGNYSDYDLLALFNKIQDMNKKFGIISYLDKSSCDTFIRMSASEYPIIFDSLLTYDRVLVGLDVESNTCFDRLHKRNRNGESAYTKESIDVFTSHYKKLFDYLESDKQRLRFVELGTLL
jgi:deoxyadenosine/deoxycytidine kinase